MAGRQLATQAVAGRGHAGRGRPGQGAGCSRHPESCAGYDLNCDGVADVLDGALLANRRGCPVGNLCYAGRFDLNGEGAISVADVMVLTLTWGGGQRPSQR